MSMIMNSLFVIVSVLISVLYLTMFERKLMSYMQLRKGPNKVGFLGLLTPMADSIKLLVSSLALVLKGKELLFWLSPVFSVIFLLLVWFLHPWFGSNNLFWYGYMFLCV